MEGTARYPAGDKPVQWISPAWLQDRIGDRVLIIDTQPDVHEYIRGHIPGAVYAHENLFRMHLGGHPASWLPPGVAEGVIRNLGVSRSGPVIVYGSRGVRSPCGTFQNDGAGQALVAYTLARYGVKHVCLLNGGLEAWADEGRPLARDFGSTAPSSFTVDLQQDFFLEYSEFTTVKDRDDVVVIDTRPAAVYEGEGAWVRAGHIPGAVNIPWQSLMAPGNPMLLLPVDEIRTLLCDHCATPDRTVICSCGTGRTATSLFLILRYCLGYPHVKMYEGSFSGWTRDPDNPTVIGQHPW
ncbi:sulfurtransferase [Methanosphaerula subterraneus]|uniref:sulfurtransferase n=1 Tax=Methanosphaerula subterraneus TaxID=3350244 RepID=UPI003F84E8FE